MDIGQTHYYIKIKLWQQLLLLPCVRYDKHIVILTWGGGENVGLWLVNGKNGGLWLVNVFSYVKQYWHEVRGKVSHNLKYHCNMVQSIQVGNMVRAYFAVRCTIQWLKWAKMSKNLHIQPTASVSKSEVLENVSSGIESFISCKVVTENIIPSLLVIY